MSCGVILHTLGDKSRNVTADRARREAIPITRSTGRSPKGITLKQNIVNDRRLTTVRYRAPGSRVWEDKSWDWAIDRIARSLRRRPATKSCG